MYVSVFHFYREYARCAAHCVRRGAEDQRGRYVDLRITEDFDYFDCFMIYGVEFSFVSICRRAYRDRLDVISVYVLERYFPDVREPDEYSAEDDEQKYDDSGDGYDDHAAL